jgi:NADH dehydrogenase FAD-containing subunit
MGSSRLPDERLRELGHRSIADLAGPRNAWTDDERWRTPASVAAELGVDVAEPAAGPGLHRARPHIRRGYLVSTRDDGRTVAVASEGAHDMPTQHNPVIVVIGAGYAGVTAANRLRGSLTSVERQRVRIVMINRSGDFVERIRLHEVAAGTIATAAFPLRDILHPDIEVIVGDVAAIDPDRKLLDLMTASGPRVEHYDTLIYAVGSQAALGAPGVREHAYLLSNPDGAAALREVIGRGAAGQRVVVVGGGATGVEAAAEIAEQRPQARVTLLSAGPILPQLPPSALSSIGATLARLGVVVRENARVAEVLADGIELQDGQFVPSEVTVWAASFSVPQLAGMSGLAVDEMGRLRVDEFLQSLDYPDIIGAGDAVRPPASVGAHLRMGCAVAIPLGGHAANTALARLRGTAPKRLDVGFLIQCISLGRGNGYIQLVRADDTPRRLHLAGRVGAVVKERVCRMVVSGPRKEATKPGSYFSPGGPRARSIASVGSS